MKRSLVLLVSLFLATVSFAQRRAVVERPRLFGGPHLSGEFPISDAMYTSGSTGMRPRIVAGGADQALVVWTNGVVRIDDEGRPLDAVPLISGTATQRPEDAVWNGENYVVGLIRQTARGDAISLVGVGTDGHIGTPLDIEQTSNFNADLAMAQSGDELAVVYSTLRNDGGTGMTVLIVSRGVVTKRIALGGSGASRMSSGSVIASPHGFLVLWPYHYTLLAPDGSLVSAASLPQHDLGAVWNGESYMLVAADARGVIARPLFPNGTLGDETVVHATTAKSVLPSIAWNGSEYRIAWQEEHRDPQPYGLGTYDLGVARMSADRTVTAEGTAAAYIWATDYRFVPPADADAIAAVGTTFVATWDGGPSIPSSNREIYAANVEAIDRQATLRLISQAATSQFPSAMTATSDGVRAFWYEWSETYTGSIDPSGRYGGSRSTPADGAPFAAWNGVDTVLAWRDHESGSVHAAFVDDAGDVVNDTVLVPASSSLDALDCNAHDCAIVWTSSDLKQHLERFSANGTPIDGPLDLPPGAVAISGRGDEYLLLMRWPGATSSHIVASRFAEGKLSDVTDLGVDAQPYQVTAAASLDGWLVIVQPHAFVLDANAAIVGETELPQNFIRMPAAWDGKNWIVTWEDIYADIQAARISPSGTLIDLFPVSASPDAERAPIVRSLGDGRSAIAYTRATTNRLYGTASRVFVRWVTE